MNAPYVALEGLDGAGTTTQARLLVEDLERGGVRCVRTFEPSDGPVGEMVRKVLRGEQPARPDALALLYAADRLDHGERVVGPALARGEVVVSDRSVYSSLAYQSADLEGADGGRWVTTINARAREPDLVIYLRVAAQTAIDRIVARGDARERFDGLDTLRRVGERYDALFGADVSSGTFTLDGAGVAHRARVAAAGARGNTFDLALVDGEPPVEDVARALSAIYRAFAAERGARYLPGAKS